MKTDDDSGPSGDPSADRFRLLFETLQDGIVDFEFEAGEPVIRTVNDAFCDLFGVERAAVEGTPLNDLIVPGDRAHRSDRFDRRTAAGKSNRAIVERRTEGGVRTLLYRGVPYRDGDRGFAVYTDLTDEIRQERELAVLNRVVRNDLSEEVDRLIELADTLAADVDDADAAATVRRMRASALTLERLGEEARDIERVLDADPTLDSTAVDEAVESALAGLRAAEVADVTVELGELPPVASGGHLDRAIAALVDNAVRHVDRAAPPVRITASDRGDTVSISVADAGPGLPEREQRLLTGVVDPTPLDHGSGLGLWLVRWIVTAAGGDIDCAERAAGGTEITLELPVASGADSRSG
ncbi:histidine kinase [Haloglomus irregulare]|jgi:PAS domain S-box-containing protein|uniref:histidine kinase n=1 Tax=Haloglomus irregulare TaxID=2234134 RepID=A0A554ND40_9EURY|nr:ATP-binding protein [Haloglomus irregulare]TSD15245.1 histidine kinase [Haloglomus irregulare]